MAAERTSLVTAVVLLLGCAAPPTTGLQVVVAPHSAAAPAWLADPSVGDRARTTSEIVVAAWHAPARRLDGYTLTLEAGAGTLDCGGTPATGCTTVAGGGGGTIVVEVGSAACVEVTVLAHELGHVALAGDSGHADARWYSADLGRQVAQALLPTVPAEDGPCLARLRELEASAVYMISWGNGV